MFLLFVNWKEIILKLSDSNNIIPLCPYLYTCGVDCTIPIELEQLLELYIWWYEWAFLQMAQS